ncbi:putative DNA-binding transcriptional regulator [Kosakonia sp. H02]|nr:putative DNA-binding transcriptional regulator [Kosakonia sp. H02]
MMKLPEKMTTGELAELLGVTRQTINRWVKKLKWKTESMPGVKGGRARNILMTKEVTGVVMKMPAMRQRATLTSLADPAAPYLSDSGARQRINRTLDLMTAEQLKEFDLFLLRVGLNGLFTFITAQQTPKA